MSFESNVLMFGALFVMGYTFKDFLLPTGGFPVQWLPGFAMAGQLEKRVLSIVRLRMRASVSVQWAVMS